MDLKTEHAGQFHIRQPDDVYENNDILDMYPEIFSIVLNHGGYFTSFPGREYVNGQQTFVDLLSIERFVICELNLIMKELGYPNEFPNHFHFRKPGTHDLDDGIISLHDDSDVSKLIEYVKANIKNIDVFVEHGISNIHQYDTTQSSMVIAEICNGDIDPILENEQSQLSDQDRQSDEDRGSDENRESEEDSDFIIDFENDMEESEVDMRDFNFLVDEEDDPLNHEAEYDIDVLDNENFESGSDSDDNIGSIRNKTLKHLKRTHGKDSGFYIGQQFANKQQFKNLLRRHTIETRRMLKTIKDDKNRVRVVCDGDVHGFEKVKVEKPKRVRKKKGEDAIGEKEGDQNKNYETSKVAENKNKGGRGNKTNPKEYLCPWVLLVSKDSITQSWLVKTLISEHKCLQSRNIWQATSTFISQELMEQIEENPNIPVKAVQVQFQKKYQICVSKMKSYRARSKAQKQLHGDYSLQYALLRDYVEELTRTNPGTTVRVEVEPVLDPESTTRQFKRIYICLGSLKQGFKAIGRDFIGLDGAFMKGPFPGQVLSAVGVDPNNCIYPVAYALVEAENINSWTWFLECLGEDLDIASNSNYTFISDRQKGILQAITNLYPSAEHRFCLRHIHENMKASGFKGKEYKDILWKLATSTTVVQFEREMDALKEMNTDAHLWLSNIDPKHWSRSHFSERAHSDILLNNMCEVFNSKIIDGRDKPIITALEYIREYIMRRIVNVLQVIDKSNGSLTPYTTTQFDTIKEEAANYNVSWNGGEQYQVSHHGDQCVVNVAQKKCSCRRWEIIGIPCKHAVAANWNMARYGQQVEIPENWVHKVYKLETWKNVYEFKIFPINGRSMWAKSKVPTTLTPPNYHKPVGRPKKKRKKSAVELEDGTRAGKLSKRNVTVTCGKCKQMGHNSRTCKGQKYEGHATSKKTVQKTKKPLSKKNDQKTKKPVQKGTKNTIGKKK